MLARPEIVPSTPPKIGFVGSLLILGLVVYDSFALAYGLRELLSPFVR